ncbi:hypothetical protein BC832DRAFT_596205 [Gaertneriomyces semiglobifer]|nr:hypothetical protein BC832DRAFT_596205 [Gaertneriomyces semiglobifer]
MSHTSTRARYMAMPPYDDNMSPGAVNSQQTAKRTSAKRATPPYDDNMSPGAVNSQQNAKRTSAKRTASNVARSAKRTKLASISQLFDWEKYQSAFEQYIAEHPKEHFSTVLKRFNEDFKNYIVLTDIPETATDGQDKEAVRAKRLARMLLRGKKHIKPTATLTFETDVKTLQLMVDKEGLGLSKCIEIEQKGLNAIKHYQGSALDVQRYLLHTWFHTANTLPSKGGSPRINRKEVMDIFGITTKAKADHFIRKLKNLKCLVDMIGDDGKNILYLTDLTGDGSASFLRYLTKDDIRDGLELLRQYEKEGIPAEGKSDKYIWKPNRGALFRNMAVDDYEKNYDDDDDDDDDDDIPSTPVNVVNDVEKPDDEGDSEASIAAELAGYSDHEHAKQVQVPSTPVNVVNEVEKPDDEGGLDTSFQDDDYVQQQQDISALDLDL